MIASPLVRWLVFLTVASIAVASFACQRLPRLYQGPRVELNYFKWFIYFTNWGYLLIAVQAGLALAVVYKYRREKTLSMSEYIVFYLKQGFGRSSACVVVRCITN